MAKKRGLGRGLGALIPPASPKPVSPKLKAGAVEVPINHITPNPHQPRQTMNPEQLQELANSITEHGLIQPLLVTQVDGDYQLIAGERRWRASKLAGLTQVPVIVKESSPQQMLELAIVENIQRADLNALEEAHAYAQLIEEFGLTQQTVAERVGKSRATITNTVRLLKLPAELKAGLAAGKISEGHARALLGLKKKSDQLKLMNSIIQTGLNVRQTEALVRKLLTNDAPPLPPPRLPPMTGEC